MMMQPIPVPSPATGPSQTLATALADELVRTTGLLATLAYELGSDADTLRRHMASLQAVDHITQSVLGIADILRSPLSTGERLAGVTLEDMADRLNRSMLGYEVRSED